MANRDLKETNRRSPSLQALSDGAERLWYRLITSVDDFGRMEADPEVVFTTCFQRVPKGWTIAKVRTCLHELASANNGEQPLITIYCVGSRWYLQITSADRTIYRRAKDSKYPAPPKNITLEGPTVPEMMHPERNPEVTEILPQLPADARNCLQIPSYPESRIPSPELRIPDPEPRTSGGEPTPAQGRGGLEEFTITPELEAWSAKEGIPNPTQYVDEFKDYWRSAGGKRKNGQAIKDWTAAFRNRLRMLKEQGKLKVPNWRENFLREEAKA